MTNTQVLAVEAPSMECQRMLGVVRSKYLPGGLPGCRGAAIFIIAVGSY